MFIGVDESGGIVVTKLLILSNNIKDTFVQPCDGEMIILQRPIYTSTSRSNSVA